MAVNQKAIDKILQSKFTSLNGKLTDVFVQIRGNEKRYDCRCCCINDLTPSTLVSHANGKKHKLMLEEITTQTSKMELLRVQRTSESKDGIPSQLQKKINDIKNQAIIGLEYVIEVHMASNFECVYHCVLCEGRFDFTTVESHLTAFNHRLKYLEKHFPTSYKELCDLDSTDKRQLKRQLTEKLCEAIEDQFGRLSVLVVDNSEFTKNRMQYTDKVTNARHIDEYMGCTFIELMQDNIRKEKRHQQPSQQNLSDFSDFEEEELKSRRASLDSISDSNGSNRSNSVISLSSSSSDLTLSTISNASSSKRREPTKQAPIQFRSNALLAESERIEQHTYKMEKFRLQMDIAEKELKKKYDGYKDTPDSYPGYINEWKVFWTRRYKELRADKQNVVTHDFKREWILEWKKMMDERLKGEVESKANEIKQKLDIQNNEKTDVESKPIILKPKASSKSLKKSLKCDKLSARRKSRSLSKELNGVSKKRVASNMKRSRSPAPKRRSRSPRRRSRSPRRRSRSPKRRSRSPRRRSRSPRRRSRSPRGRSRSPRGKSRSPRGRSRSPRGKTRSQRKPQYSRTPTRTRPRKSPRRSRSRSLRRSKSPTHRSNIYTSYEKRSSPKTLKQPPLKHVSFFPSPKRVRTSLSPKLVEKTRSPLQAVKPIMKRRNTSYFSTPMISSILAQRSAEKQKLCAPVPPRIAMESGSYYSPSEGRLNLEYNNRGPRTTPQTDSLQNRDDEPVTIISVLSLLTALEDILGSLGPKVIELMHQALSMDKVKAGSSNQLLDNDDHCVLFETIKEKLKGLISADLVEKIKQNAVKKAIKNMAFLVHQSNVRQRTFALESTSKVQQTPSFALPQQITLPPPPTVSKEERDVIAAKLSTALRNEGRTDITELQLEYLIDVYLAEVAEKEKNSLAKNKNNSSPQEENLKRQRELDEVVSISSMDLIDIENKDELYDHITNRVDVPASSSTSQSFSTVPVSLPSKVPVSSSSKSTIESSSKATASMSKVPASTSKIPASTSKIPASTSKIPASTSKVPASMSKEPVSMSKGPVSMSKGPVSMSKGPVSMSKGPVSMSKGPVSMSKGPVSMSKGPVSMCKGPVSTSKVPVSTSQIPASSSASATRTSTTILSTSSSTVPVSAPQRTTQNISMARPNKAPSMCPPPSESESVTLSDADLKILMKKFSSLSECEQVSYLSYINKLEAIDPQRMKRLRNEIDLKEKSNDSIPKPNNDKIEKKIPSTKVDSKQKIFNKSDKPNSTLLYSPGQNLSSDSEGTPETNNLMDSDSDSDDSAILASSIANTQFQIARMNKDLTPKPTGRKIPVVDSVQTQQFSKRIETVSLPREDIYNNQNPVPRPTFPTLHYQQQHNFQPQPPPQQYPHQQQYQQFQRQLAPRNPMQLPPNPAMNYFNQTHPQYQGQAPYQNYYPRY